MRTKIKKNVRVVQYLVNVAAHNWLYQITLDPSCYSNKPLAHKFICLSLRGHYLLVCMHGGHDIVPIHNNIV